ncbi:MAG: glycosyltransferase family 4 protein [Marmoricola sp.]
MTSTWPPVPAGRVPARRLPEPPDPSRVKVLHVITRFIAGSGGNTLLSAAGMDSERYESWVAAMPGGPLWVQAREAGVRTVEVRHMREWISPWHDLRACLELVALIRRERFTVVHTHCSKAGLIGRVAARLAGVPVVVHTFHILAAHQGLSRPRRRLYLTLERVVRRYAHRYVAVAPRVAREAVEQRIAPPGSVTVVPSAIDLASVPTGQDPLVRAELGIAADAPVVGTVGRIDPQKAPLDFVRLCAQVHRQHPDAVFVMVGDTTLHSDRLEEETRAEAERLGVPLHLTGFRADAARVAASFDVYVVPSRYEGLGRALTEAMASGRPVVATAVNGVPDLVEHGVTGLLAGVGDVAALAEATLWLLDHPDEARMLGDNARERVRTYFTTEVMCEALDRIYSELLGLPGSEGEPAAAVLGAPLIRRTA